MEIEIGSFVKIERDGQRMWWQVEGFEDGGIRARLNNHPWQEAPKPCSYQFGDVELFGPEEFIFGVLPPAPPVSNTGE